MTAITQNLSLTVNNVSAALNPPANGVPTGLYGFDANTTGPANLRVTLQSDLNAVLYLGIMNLTTFQVLQMTNAIKFVTDFTTNTTINGTGVLG
jgi:hypothetical protein